MRTRSLFSARRMTPARAAAAVVLSAVLLALLAAPPFARAGDVESAKRQLEKVKVDLSSQSWNSIGDDIKATEEFLDGVPDADRAPIQKELDGIKKQAEAGIREYKTKDIVERATRDLNSASDDIAARPGVALDKLNDVAQRINSDDAKKYADPASLKPLQDRLASLQKMAGEKVAKQKLDFAAPIVKELDDAMAAQPFKDAKDDQDIYQTTQRLNTLMGRVRGALEGVPAGDPRVKAINEKLASYTKQIDAASGGAASKQAGQRLADMWKAQHDYFKGWEDEKQGPTWEDYSKKQSAAMGDLLMPKTVELLQRVGYWLNEDSSVKDLAAQNKDEPTVKATMADAHKTFDAAAAKLNTNYNNLLAEAEKLPTPSDELVRLKPRDLADSADHWFKGTPFHDANVDRAKKLEAKWSGAVAGANKAREDLLNKMISQASANWPKIASDLKGADDFTPDKAGSFKGKLVHLTGSNRSGWDYAADYPFARAINGLPVAGKYDPNVKAAVETVLKQTGQNDLPDDGWDVYAVVDGPGKIQERTNASGKVTVNGTEVGTYKEEGHRPIDCTVMTIVAMHAGPVAVGPQGYVTESGAVQSTGAQSLASSATGGFSFLHLLLHLFELALCVAAAGLIVLKGKPAPVLQPVGVGAGGGGDLGDAGGSGDVAAAPGVGPLTADTLGFAGLGLAALGLLWLLSKLILGDLLPALSLLLAGVYIASEWLRAKGILPRGVYDAIKPLGLPIAGAAVLFGFLHLFLYHWYLF